MATPIREGCVPLPEANFVSGVEAQKNLYVSACYGRRSVVDRIDILF